MINATDPIDELRSAALVGSLLECAETIVAGPPTLSDASISGSTVEWLDAEAVCRLASVLASHFRLAVGFTVSDDDRRDLAQGVHDEAASVRRASAAALGAIESIVDAMLLDETDAVVDLTYAAVEVIDVIDLFDAAASVSASIAWNIADRLSLDPVIVVRELRDHAPEPRSTTVLGCRSTVRLSNRSGRQTWSGRNSQCQGSRGTDSTQPNRGPLVFNH